MHYSTAVITACLFTILVVESSAKPASKTGKPNKNEKAVRVKRDAYEFPPFASDGDSYPDEKRLVKKLIDKKNFGMVLGGGYKFGGKPSQYNFRRYYRRDEPEPVVLADDYPYDLDASLMDRRRRAGFSRVLSGGWRGTYFGKRGAPPYMDSEQDDIRAPFVYY